MGTSATLLAVIRDFAGEAQERCESATLAILSLEKGSEEPALLDTIARDLHTLKGSAGTLGLVGLSTLAHGAEDLLADSRRRGGRIQGRVADILLEALDAFLTGVRLAGEAGVGPQADSFGDLLARLAGRERPATEAPPPVAATGRKDASPAGADVAVRTAGAWRVDTAQVMSLMRDVERVRDLRLRADRRRLELEAVAARLVGAKGLDDAWSDAHHQVLAVSRGLRADAEQASDTITSLEQGLRSISTLPIRTLLEPLHRAVRDLCRQAGKEARLSVVGDELALDRRVLETLRGPLVQLIRNCVAHGIESTELRESRGKHREGAIVVRAEQVGNTLFLTVEDDGNGVDFDQIRRAAHNQGLVPADDANRLDSNALVELLFRPGFSTQVNASEISGRGFGLDVVRSAVNELRGRVDVESKSGQGTRFILTLPVDLGSSPVLLVRAADQVFGLPVTAVESGVAMREDHVLQSRTETRLQLGPDVLRLRDLGVLLGLRERQEWQRGQPLIVLRSKGERLALAVDAVVGTIDLVVRPMPDEFRTVPAYLGAAALALGDLVLVLNPTWVTGRGAKALPPHASPRRRVLVVDDSITARAMYRTALESGGWNVSTAPTADCARSMLRLSRYDAVLLDVALGESDGIGLTSELRARPETANLPIALISAKSVERERGLAAGATLFLDKRDCTARYLLEQLESVVAKGAP